MNKEEKNMERYTLREGGRVLCPTERLEAALERLAAAPAQPQESAGTGKPYFASAEERDAFLRRHQSQLRSPVNGSSTTPRRPAA